MTIEIALPPASASDTYDRLDFRSEAMATEYRFILYSPRRDDQRIHLQSVAREAMEIIQDLDARLSRYRPDSQVSRVNATASRGPVRVAPDVFALFQDAGRLHRRTAGAFDVTVGPLLKVWGLYRFENRLPTRQELDDARSRVGFDRLHLEPEECSVRFTVPGMHVDFGGIGKGYALDKAAELFRRFGVTSGLLSAGTSTMVVLGPPPSQNDWKIRIRNPYNDMQSYDELELALGALSTSGAYERFIEVDGKRYGHIIDPRSGMPVRGELMSATSLAPTGLETDALSTAFFVMGMEGVVTYCEQFPENQAILVIRTDDDGQERIRHINMDAKKEQ